MKKNCCGVYYKWVIIQRDKNKTVLDLWNHAPKKELDQALRLQALIHLI